MSIEERQRIEPHEIFDLWIHWERGPMLVDDVWALPRSPMIVVEGTTVPPDRSQLLLLDRPGGRAENPVFQHYAEGILEQGRHHGAPILAVKGSIEETIEAAEEHFATELARGPRIETAEERWGLLREANEALAFQVRTGSARPWATWTPETLTRDFICECDEPECRAVLIIPVAEWERLAAEGPVLAHAD